MIPAFEQRSLEYRTYIETYLADYLKRFHEEPQQPLYDAAPAPVAEMQPPPAAPATSSAEDFWAEGPAEPAPAPASIPAPAPAGWTLRCRFLMIPPLTMC